MATILKSNSTATGSYDERVNSVAEKVISITNSENKSKDAMTQNIITAAIALESPEVKFKENRVSKVWPTFLKDVLNKIKKTKK